MAGKQTVLECRANRRCSYVEGEHSGAVLLSDDLSRCGVAAVNGPFAILGRNWNFDAIS
jgi:hypothetical protein